MKIEITTPAFMHRIRFWQVTACTLLAILLTISGVFLVRYLQETEVTVGSELGGNIFPSAIISTATTGSQIIQYPSDYIMGNATSGVSVRVVAPAYNTKVHVELGESPFWKASVTEFVLPEKDQEYLLYPEIIWDYEALKNNKQPEPVTIPVQVTVGRKNTQVHNATFCVRSINDCLLGYRDEKMHFHDTGIYFAAYVNEEHPMIDQLLREALDTRIVKRFIGLQQGEKMVEKQVYALWYMLQKRAFSYSSVSNSTLASNIVYCQRVRTLDDALESSQINCVDGTVLFASLLRAINIEPVLIRIPGHMFVGYYTDSKGEHLQVLETTMLDEVRLDDYFPDENLDSLSSGKSQAEMSRLTFDKAKEYAQNKYQQHVENLVKELPNYMFLKISKDTRAKVLSIGR